jgi:hypothetical protein
MQSPARRPPTSRLLVRLIFLSVVLSALVGISAPAASAARPCWKDLVDDYWADNRVDKVYPISCYRDAMEALPSDVKQYSDAQDDLRRALLAAIRDERDSGGTRSGGTGGSVTPPPPAIDDQGAKGGFIREVLDNIGPKNASSIPVPLLVLATIALLLVGAAGVSYGARWYQGRRVGVAPPEPRP